MSMFLQIINQDVENVTARKLLESAPLVKKKLDRLNRYIEEIIKTVKLEPQNKDKIERLSKRFIVLWYEFSLFAVRDCNVQCSAHYGTCKYFHLKTKRDLADFSELMKKFEDVACIFSLLYRGIAGLLMGEAFAALMVGLSLLARNRNVLKAIDKRLDRILTDLQKLPHKCAFQYLGAPTLTTEFLLDLFDAVWMEKKIVGDGVILKMRDTPQYIRPEENKKKWAFLYN